MLVGEQPGDQEDLAGRPFVGPAGRLLNELLEESGLERERVFVTNAVKHFKWEPRGKRRLHQRPNVAEIDACHIWLEQELACVHPLVIVALGATAARGLLGARGSIEKLRKQPLVHRAGARIFVTYHPSAVLRADERAQRLRGDLLEDLRLARAALTSQLRDRPEAAALVAGRRS
jgi:uracil-DNA glycosylase